MKSNTAIIVAARDSYSDTWDAFFTLFFKYWPDCPYPVYLFSEKKIFPDHRVLPLIIENDPSESWGKQWEGRIRKAILQMNVEHFIVLHTDYFLSQKIDTDRILELEKILRQPDIGYIRLTPVPPPKLPYAPDKRLGIISKTDRYSISLQATFWKKNIFEYFLVPHLNPGEYEIEGSKTSFNVPELFLSSKKGCAALPYVHGISKDTWQYDAIQLLRREGFQVNPNRKKEKLSGYLSRILYIKMLRYNLKVLRSYLHSKKISL